MARLRRAAGTVWVPVQETCWESRVRARYLWHSGQPHRAGRLVERFQLKKFYGMELEEDTRKTLAKNTVVLEDRRSGIITITVTDHEAKRAAAIARLMWTSWTISLPNCPLHCTPRARFLEERLRAVKQDLDQASREFSQFASKKPPSTSRNRARHGDAAATLEGELIAANRN